MSEDLLVSVDKLRDLGYAVVVFNPDELEGVDPSRIEDRMTETGWDAIYTLSEYVRD
jgi:hypothetical protein